MSATKDFDVIVIGGGGSGYAAASTAARLGVRVAMVEGSKLGGTCLNVGCVPTKVLVRSAQVLESARRAAEFGVEVGEVRLDFEAVMRRKRAIIESFSGEGPVESLRAQHIELLQGPATFVDPHTLRVGDAVYTGARFVIATGSASVIPDLPGLADIPYLTSDTILELEALPQSLLIVGGGIIGCEFASIFNTFGSRVTVVGRRLLGSEDEDVSEELYNSFTRRGIEVLRRSRATGFRRERGQTLVSIRYDDGHAEEREAEAVLLAVGRRASHDGLSLPAAGVHALPNGSVEVGADMSTNVPHIWASGDVTGMHMYTHSGDYMGEIAGGNAAGVSPRHEADFAVVPRPVYSLPEVAAIGLTEREADCVDCDLEIAKVHFKEISRARINGETEGWCKIIAERVSGRILGASIIGPEANELIGEIATAMAGGVSAWTLGDTLHPYPTVSEIVRWTADQIGKDREPRAGTEVRQALYTETAPELRVRPSASGRDEPVTPEEVREASEARFGYGQEPECVEEATVL